jgi:hypothetical protein
MRYVELMVVIYFHNLWSPQGLVTCRTDADHHFVLLYFSPENMFKLWYFLLLFLFLSLWFLSYVIPFVYVPAWGGQALSNARSDQQPSLRVCVNHS